MTGGWCSRGKQPAATKQARQHAFPFFHAYPQVVSHLLAAFQRSRHFCHRLAPRLLAPDRHRLLHGRQCWNCLADGSAHCKERGGVGGRLVSDMAKASSRPHGKMKATRVWQSVVHTDQPYPRAQHPHPPT